VSDVGGHPRGLQALTRALDEHLKPGMENAHMVKAVVARGEFADAHSRLLMK
jgi:hypothetical protein